MDTFYALAARTQILGLFISKSDTKTLFVVKIKNSQKTKNVRKICHSQHTSRRLLVQSQQWRHTNNVFFFSMWVFFHEHSRIAGLQGKGEGISLTPHYHFHPLHRHLDISRAITAESSPLHIAGSRTRTGNLWFPSASR